VGQPLDLSPTLAALGLSEMVDENMSNAARVHAIECGKDARGRVLIAFGGAAPLHAARVAEKLGMDRILIPTSAGVGSAVGFLRAPIAYEIVRSGLQRLSEFDAARANALLAEMRAEAAAIVRRGAPDAELAETRFAFMRYRGQGHEVMVPLPVETYAKGDARPLVAAFERAYRALYSRTIPGVDVELVSWALTLTAPSPAYAEAAAEERPYEPDPAARRALVDPVSGETVEVPVYRRAQLRPGARIAGPAIVTEDETSIVVGAAFDATVDAYGSVELIRRR
jgi:N-methylhydantoinase A